MFLKYQHSAARSLLFPVFTRRQALFLMVVCLLSASLYVLSSNDVAHYLALAFLIAAIGVLSVSSPAFLVTEKGHINEILIALESGKWRRNAALDLWERRSSSAFRWENDTIKIIDAGELTFVVGPYYTLNAIRKLLKYRTDHFLRPH
jgi:hypothetical protein